MKINVYEYMYISICIFIYIFIYNIVSYIHICIYSLVRASETYCSNSRNMLLEHPEQMARCAGPSMPCALTPVRPSVLSSVPSLSSVLLSVQNI